MLGDYESTQAIAIYFLSRFTKGSEKTKFYINSRFMALICFIRENNTFRVLRVRAVCYF